MTTKVLLDPASPLPVGPLIDASPAREPTAVVLKGRFGRVETLDPSRHSVDLWLALKDHDQVWTYAASGPFADSPQLQRTALATEAQYLLARYVFETLGYRRYEWKCNSHNAASCGAALRLGFGFEGVHRQHMIVKGRSRDTAWYAMLDTEWPSRKLAFERWLSPDNFDAEGRQKARLSHDARLQSTNPPAARR